MERGLGQLRRDERAAFAAMMAEEVGSVAHARADAYLAGLRHALSVLEVAGETVG